MTQNRSLVASSTYVLEGPQEVFEGDQPFWTVTKLGVTTIANDATLGMDVYKGSQEKSADFLTGSMSASGNIATTKTFTGLKGGDNLFVRLYGTCDGVLLTFAVWDLYVRKPSGK